MSVVKDLFKHNIGSSIIDNTVLKRHQVRSASGKVFNVGSKDLIKTGNFNNTIFRKVNVSTGTIAVNSTFDFIVPQMKNAYLNAVYLKLACDAPAAGNAMLPPILWINEIEIIQGGVVLERVKGTELYYRNRLMWDANEQEGNCELRGTLRYQDATLSSFINSAEKSADATAYTPFIQIHCATFGAPLLTETLDDIRVRITTHPTAYLDQENTGTITGASSALYCEFKELNESSYKNHKMNIESAPQVYPYCQVLERQKETLSSGVNATFNLQEDSQVLAGALIHLRPDDAVSNYATASASWCGSESVSYTHFNITDEKNISMTGSGEAYTGPSDNAQFIKPAFSTKFREFESGYDLNKLVLVNFANNLQETMKNSIETGWRESKNSWKLSITTTGDGAFCYIYLLRWVALRQDGRKLSILT